MRKQLKMLVDSYSHKSGRWTLVMVLGITVFPILFKSLAMLATRNALSAWLVILFDFLGWTGACLFFATAVRVMDGRPRVRVLRGLWRAFYRGGIWLVAAALLSDMAYTLYDVYGSRLAVAGSPAVYMIGLVLITLIVGFMLSLLVFWLLCLMADPEQNAPFRQAFRGLVRRPLLCLGTVLSVGLLLFGIPLFYDFLLKILPGLSLSFMIRIGGAVLLSLMQWLVLQPLLTVLYRHAGQLAAAIAPAPAPVAAAVPDMPAPVEAAAPAKAAIPFYKKFLPSLVAVALIAAAGIYSLLGGYPMSAVTAVRQDIQGTLDNEKIMAAAGDYASAAYYHKIAEARLLAWKGAALGTQKALEQAVALAPSDEQVQFLSALKNPNPLAALEQGFLNSTHSQDWALALLDAYGKTPGLTAVQQQRKAELLRICILQGYFLKAAILPENLASRQDDLAKTLADLEKALVPGKYYTLVARVGESGGLTRQLVLDALALAEAYPDQINMQYLAMSYGSSFLQDNADYYKRTADAAIRYDSLFMKQKAKTASREKLLEEKLTVAKTLMTSGELVSCVSFLDNVTFTSPELTMMKASCLFSLKEYEKCLAATADYLKKQPDDPQALYLAAICSLRLQKTTDSIQYAIRLADITQKAKNPLDAERLLYPYLLRFTLNDSSGGYTTETYSKLGEADMTLLKSNTFLYNYATAARQWAVASPESRAEALRLLDKVLAANPALSRAIYLKGAIYNELLVDGKALEFLKASLALDDNQPTVWYALASFYDRTKQYKEAYAACQKVLDLLPSTDHASDVFGVSIHASQMMSSLAQYIKAGD